MWVKSSLSFSNGNCVEVKACQRDPFTCTEVRDSKDPEGPSLHFTAAEWEAFIEGAKKGEFDFWKQKLVRIGE